MKPHPMGVRVSPGGPTLPRVGKPVMVMRSVRVPAKLWAAAREIADQREENISDVIRDALERYVKRGAK